MTAPSATATIQPPLGMKTTRSASRMLSAPQQVSDSVTTCSTTQITVHPTIQHPSIVSIAASCNKQSLSHTNTSTTPLIQPPSSLQNATNLVIQPSEDIIPQQICLPSDVSTSRMVTLSNLFRYSAVF